MPNDDLPPELKDRLTKIQSEISLTQITVSFSLEQRRDNGRKMSSFYSANAVRQLPGVLSAEWTIEEARLAGCILSKHVVETVYRDSVKRGILTVGEARTEAKAILSQYDANIKRMLRKSEGNDDQS